MTKLASTASLLLLVLSLGWAKLEEKPREKRQSNKV